MEDNNCIEARFQALLNRFVDHKTLTPESVCLSHGYLFGHQELIQLIKNKELRDTLLYLKDVMEINDLYSLDDILGYYENKKRSLRTFISSHFIQEDAPAEFGIRSGCLYHSYQKTVVACSSDSAEPFSATEHVVSCYAQSIKFPSPALVSNILGCSFIPQIVGGVICQKQDTDHTRHSTDSIAKNLLTEVE